LNPVARSWLVWWLIGSSCKAAQQAVSLPHSQPICPVSDIVLGLPGNKSTFVDGLFSSKSFDEWRVAMKTILVLQPDTWHIFDYYGKGPS
jgi:hypothetical protein